MEISDRQKLALMMVCVLGAGFLIPRPFVETFDVVLDESLGELRVHAVIDVVEKNLFALRAVEFVSHDRKAQRSQMHQATLVSHITSFGPLRIR